MRIPKYLLFATFMRFLATFVVHGQKQTGFISLDCGLPHDAEYFDERTGIYYSSDASFIESGVNNNISSSLKYVSLDQQFHALRSFPQGTRNCYTLLPALGKGNKYLIRARFMYGNYDGKGQLPAFDLHLGVELWDTVMFNDASNPVSKEIIHVASSDYIHVCLVNTGRGTPIISALELRPLNNSMYQVTGSLNLIHRLDMGSTGPQVIRYKDDIYDRLWRPNGLSECSNCTILSTTGRVDPLPSNVFVPPSAVMQTAFTVSENSSEAFIITWDSDNSTDQYYLCLHFAEVEFLFFDTREFNIYVNDKWWSGPYKPSYWGSDIIYGRVVPTHTTFEVLMNRTVNSTLQPLINAMEVYAIKELFHPQTDENDVAAILKVKEMYGVTRNWQGDPCTPNSYIWSGLDCKSDGLDPPRIISMNISSSGLTGVIAPYITNLTKLESLDLSYNNLTGEVPDFLSGLASLRALNLKGNNFTGSIPAALLSRYRKGLLSLSVDGNVVGNKESCESVSCKKKRSSKFLVPIVATIAALVVLILATWAIFWFIRRKKGKVIGLEPQTSKIDGSLEVKNRQFTFLEVLSMTNNFQRVVGKGGFGTVYHGHVEGTQVAVKMLSPSSSQGYKEFQAEAKILINVHHKNLTSLVGYCNEGTHIGLIYEYMANGDLESHLSDKNPYVLSWQHRLQIAMDAAQGLEYLHNGCKPAIVHRDVKTTNILLNDDFQAKLSDFGLSRVFPVDGEHHISTVVAGTPGYLDPEYYTSNRLTEKSDVYSFGVVLLEMITNRPPIMRHQDETTHIIHWASSMLANGDVKKIVNTRFRGDFDLNSVWKAVELAMVCVSRTSAERPTMNYVVIELKECLAAEMARHETGQDDSIGEIPMSLDSGLGPLAR